MCSRRAASEGSGNEGGSAALDEVVQYLHLVCKSAAPVQLFLPHVYA